MNPRNNLARRQIPPPADFAQAHISIKETFALHEVLWLLVDNQPEYLRGSTATIDVDSTTMFYPVRNSRAKDERMHLLVCQLVWLQVEADFTLKLRWIPLRDNAVSDDLTRPDKSEHVRLWQKVFNQLWKVWGGFDMNIMVTIASSQRPPNRGEGQERPQPFYSKYHTAGSSAIDVFAQDVGHMPSFTDPCFGYCFPPSLMVGIVTAHLRVCRARAVIIIPAVRLSWFSLVASASVRSLPVASLQESNVFFRVHHLKGENSFVFLRWGMRTVEEDFRFKKKCIYIYIVDLKGKGDFPFRFPRLCNPQALHHLLSRLRTFLTLIGGLLAPLLTGQGPSLVHNQTLPELRRSEAAFDAPVATAKAMTHSISASGAPRLRRYPKTKPGPGTLHVNMDAIRTRFPQFTTAANASASAARCDSTAFLFEQILLSRPTSWNSFAGWMPAGHDAEHQSTPYTVQRKALRHLILAPPRPATAPCATLMNPCGPTTSPNNRRSTNAT